MYDNTFIAELEPSILNAGYEFIDNLCAQFDTKKRISSHDLNIKGKISLGKANNTKDKDECSVYSSGILTTKNGLPSLNLTFKCWQGGGQIFKWSSYELTKSFLEERGHSTKELSDKLPTPSLTPGKTGQDASKPVTPPKSTAQSKELSFEQKRALATRLYTELETTGSSAYLRKKGFEDDDLRLLTDIRFGNNFIAIPLFASFDDHENCEPCGIQKIYDEKTKGHDKFFTKNSHMVGSFHVIGTLENIDKILICEGFATGLTLHIAKNLPIIIAFNAGNLKPVAKQVREKFPTSEIIICADNDQWKASEINPNTGKRKGNAGISKGSRAAKVCNGKLVYPIFEGQDYSSKPTDFNDLHKLAGINEVKNQLEKNLLFDELVKQFRVNYPHKPEGIDAEKQLPKQIVEKELNRAIRIRLPELNLKNTNGEIFEVERYVNPFTFTTTDKKTVIYTSNMGTGKTTAIETSIKEAIKKGFSICSIAHRVSLVHTLATRLGVSFYRRDGAVNVSGENIAICVDSTYRLIDKSYDIVFIDEIEQVLRQLISKRGNQQGNHRGEIFNEFVRLISNAQILVVADAHLSDLTLNFVKKLREGIPVEFHTSRHKFGKGRTCYLWNNQNAIIDDMLMNLKDGRIAVATDSRKESDRLFKRFQAEYPEKKGIVVNNHTREDEDVKKLLANINDEINQLDYIIHSPTISSGISIDAIETYQPFTAHYGVFSPQSGPSTRDAWQQILRFRAKFDVNVFINPRIENKPVVMKKLINNLRTNAKCDLLSNQGAEIIRGYFQNIPDVDELFPENNLKKEGLYYLELQATVDRNKQLNNFKQAFSLQAVLDGWTIQYIDTASKNKNTKTNKKLSDEAQIKNICNAQYIGPSRAEKLKTKQLLTTEERNLLHKYELWDFYKQDVDEQLVRIDKDGEMRKCIERIEYVHSQELALDKDLEFLKQRTTNSDNASLNGYKGEKNKAEVNQLFMEEMGFFIREELEDDRRFIKIYHDGSTLSKKNFDGSFIEQNAEKIQAAYLLRKDFKCNPLQTVFDFLRRLGLGFICKRGSKGRDNTYSCDKDKLEFLNEILKKRGVPDTEHILTLGVSPFNGTAYKVPY